MAKICGKHDVLGDECWCCEEEKLNATPGAREKAYKDPAFLKKRGGLDAGQAMHAAVLGKLAQLNPEQIDKLVAMLGGVQPSAPAASPGGGTRRVIASA